MPLIADIFRANGHEPPPLTTASLSLNVHSELLATGRFLTVLPGFMLFESSLKVFEGDLVRINAESL